MFKVLSQRLQDTLATVFERHFAVKNVTEIVHHTFKPLNKILSWLHIMKQKLTKLQGKLSVAQKSKPALRRTLQ